MVFVSTEGLCFMLFFPSSLASVSCRFSLPFIGFCFLPFFPSYGFCFMPFFPSLYTWLLFYAVFPFILGTCFMPFFPSHHTWLLFHAVFPFPLYLAFVLCQSISVSVHQLVNKSVLQLACYSINQSICQSFYQLFVFYQSVFRSLFINQSFVSILSLSVN